MCDETLRKKEFGEFLIDNIDKQNLFEISDEQVMFLKEFVESQTQISESRITDYTSGILSKMITDEDKLAQTVDMFSDYEYNLIKLCKEISNLINE